MRIPLLLAICSSLALPALADDPMARNLNFLMSSLPVVGLSGPAPDPRIDCPTCTPAQMTQAQKLLANADWTVHSDPNPGGFLAAINTDPLFQANNYALAFQLSGLLALMQADLAANSAVALQAHWNGAVANFGSTWLTQPVQQMILNHAAEYNIPVTPPILVPQ